MSDSIIYTDKSNPNIPNGSLIKAINDYKVYEIKDNKKHWLDITVEEFLNLGYSWDEVYVINWEEWRWYETGEEAKE